MKRFAVLVMAVAFVGAAVLAVMFKTQAAAPRAAQPQPAASAFKIKFDYSKVDDALFNDIVKEQIESGAHIIEQFVDTPGEITITVVADETGDAYATGGPGEWDENTEEKSIAKTGGIRFGKKHIVEVRDGKSGIQALTMHEIFHCLGFVGSAKAIAKNLKDGMYSGPNVLKVNNGKPVRFDGAHFPQGTEDADGISPRMMNGGGNTLSALDLAVLADLGYDVPLIANAKGIPTLYFRFPAGYYDVEEENGKTVYGVSGMGGNDILQAFKAGHNYSLVGGGGDDMLVGGTGDDSMDGDNFRTKPEIGKPGKDTFVIRKDGGKDTIHGFESGKDEIWLSPALGITEEQIEKALETFPQEIRKPFTTPDGKSMVMIQKVNLIKIGEFEIIVNPAGENPKASDFKIEDWKP
jgi:hypothetical protein